MVMMKRYESQFILHSSKFTIMDLELPEDQAALESLLKGMSAEVNEAVRKNIYCDFGFLVGIFGFVAWVCVVLSRIHRRMGNAKWSKVLLVLAAAQAVATLLDITEDVTMLSWLSSPDQASLEFWFKPMVRTKFAIVFLGISVAIIAWIATLTKKQSAPPVG
jgi:hypothetical protein